ncbi:hypothetical protein [Nocardia aurantiaca]|uniref:Uncharacterized protein n=1 Tax=Nocardia aurantiaca TaxID=2675850 RepID=A0A6I3KZP6_9NOCA|nr:hypothetical protein [Nocardia aurantiaca]MTE15522.1 hypothetical protein [Nocardia aurantiaca]
MRRIEYPGGVFEHAVEEHHGRDIRSRSPVEAMDRQLLRRAHPEIAENPIAPILPGRPPVVHRV